MAMTLRTNPHPSHSLFDLPAEVRSVIYKYLLHSYEPGKVCMEWDIHSDKLWGYPVVGVSKAWKGRWRRVICRIQNATALMRTCLTLWNEVAPYLYDSIIFEFTSFNDLRLFSNRLTPRCKLLVQRIELHHKIIKIDLYNPHSKQLGDNIAALPGLRRLVLWRTWRDADTAANGSPWRSHSVTSMRAVQRSSPQLSRTYCREDRCGQVFWIVMVIFKTSAEGPQQGEIEFNLEAEYGKILVARRRKEVAYEEDVLLGWELARDIGTT